MLKAVIFDMDGVIIDSEPFHYRLNQEFFQELKLEITDQEYNDYIGLSVAEMWRIIKDKHQLPNSLSEIMQTQRLNIINYIQTSEECPIPGVVDLITALRDQKILLAVASSSPRKYIELVLKKFSLRDSFQVLVSGEEVKAGKPAPDIFLKAAEQLQVDPQECVVIEDSSNGIRAAQKAGILCVAYRNSNSGKQDLSLANLIIKDFGQLDMKKIMAL